MANVKISALPSITTLTDASVIPGVQSGETRKVLASEVQRYSLSGLPDYAGNVLANNVTANIYSVNTAISPAVTTGQIAWSATERTFNMGTDDTGAANYWNGELAEMIMFTRALNSSEIDMVEEYLKNHWKL